MTQITPDAIAPDAALIRHLAEAAIAALPEPYRAAAALVACGSRILPTPNSWRRWKSTTPIDLTGLYDGVPLTEKSVTDQTHAARSDISVPPPDPGRMD